MFRPRVIPVLLLKNKGLVKTVGFKKSTSKYIGDPINAVRIFNDLEADELVFLDITASVENRLIDIDLIKKIGDEAFMPFAVGGGIRTVNEIKLLLNAGVEKVVINTSAALNPDFIRDASEQFGSQSVIVSVDYKRNLWGKAHVFIKGGTASFSADPIEFAVRMQACGAGEILLHSIEKDGTMTGYDLNMIEKVSGAVDIPVIVCGGAGQLNDLKEAILHGASALAAGSIFVFHGPRNAVLVNYPEKGILATLFTDKSN